MSTDLHGSASGAAPGTDAEAHWGRQGWLLSCLYYERDADDPWFDAHFERFAADLLPPLVASLHAEDPDWRIHWMRYSERGSHLRLHVWGDQEALTRRAQPMIEQAVAALHRQQPDGLGRQMRLTEMGRRLNARTGTLSDTRAAGTHDIGWAGREGEASVYATQRPFDLVQGQLQREAADSLDVIVRQAPMGWRLRYWQQYAERLPLRLGLDDAQRAIGLAFLARTWQETFGISPLDLIAVKVPFEADSQGDATPPMPPEGADIQTWRAQPTAQWAMQLLGLLHLCANRLGVSIIDEIRWCQQLARDSFKRLDAPTQQGVRQDIEVALAHWRNVHVHVHH